MISSGFQTTVQDLGRFGYAHLGISASGAADPVSLRFGNRLVGNPEDAPALEMTLTGGEFEFEVACRVAVTGAGMDPRVNGHPVPMWTSIPVNRGKVLSCGAAASGARTYLSIRGGLDVPLLLGSASTHLMTGMGGFCGRPLRPGDVVPLRPGGVRAPFARLRVDPGLLPYLRQRNDLRVTPGPQAGFFNGEERRLFHGSRYHVSEKSDRMGLRLEGPVLAGKEGRPEILTEGVSLGAVQVTHKGSPIILFVDHQTTGGYPKIANVVAADIRHIGQLRPREVVTFTEVSLAEARGLHQELESILRRPLVPA